MPWYDEFESFIQLNEPLGRYTWLGLGGPAEVLATPRNEQELAALVRRCHQEQVPVRLLGAGSHVLVRDEGVPGVVIRIVEPHFGRIQCQGRQVVAQAGAMLAHLVSAAVQHGLAGLETLVGIPGTVGGALRGNTSAQGNEIGRWVHQVRLLNAQGETVIRGRDELFFGYRQSNLDELVILEAVFELEAADPAELTRRMQKHWIAKRADQPLGQPCAGYVFKNPRGHEAAALIEAAGLKGMRIGGAEVAQRNPNFIVAHPEATARDVLRLIEVVRSRVREATGVELELDLEIW